MLQMLICSNNCSRFLLFWARCHINYTYTPPELTWDRATLIARSRHFTDQAPASVPFQRIYALHRSWHFRFLRKRCQLPVQCAICVRHPQFIYSNTGRIYSKHLWGGVIFASAGSKFKKCAEFIRDRQTSIEYLTSWLVSPKKYKYFAINVNYKLRGYL